MVLQYLLQITVLIGKHRNICKADQSTCKQQTRCAVHAENYHTYLWRQIPANRLTDKNAGKSRQIIDME
jgi:hypothetical protein